MRFTLNTGREISLTRLHQWGTYYGVLAGLPNRHGNAERIERALESARKHCLEKAQPYLIEPRVSPIEPVNPPPARLLEITGRTAAEHAEYMARRQHEKLPGVTCVGVFDSNELNKPDSEPYSSLTILWFQDSFALPIDDAVLDEMRQIDWEAWAVDWNW